MSTSPTVSASQDANQPNTRSLRNRPSHVAMLVALVVLIVAFVLVGRSWRSTSAQSPAKPVPPAMPASPAIEAADGIRLTSVDVTAGGGMIELRYQVLDSDKAAAIHAADSAPIVVDSHGVKYADPGMVGHSHVGSVKSPGTTDYILLANASGGVRPGSVVTIKVGALELRNVRVQ